MGPCRADTHWDFLEVEPNRRLVQRGQSGPMGMLLRQEIELDGEGTKVSV